MIETLLIIILIIQILVLIGLALVLVLGRKKSTGGNIENTNLLKEEVTKSVNGVIMDLSERLNRQLLENAKISSDAIADFRVNINKELDVFKEKINVKLQDEFKSLNENVDKKMTGINEKVEDRLQKGFATTNETFTTIKERMAVMETTQKKIEDLSGEMLGLQNILTNNQQRGAFGEYQLEQILYATFGDNSKLYATQYEIKNPKESEKVRADSVIFMPNGLICIDSKFPYSSYSKLFEGPISDTDEVQIVRDLKKDVKKHIDDISRKYIVEGLTTDFAVMFLPSDGVLALIHMKLPEMVEYANNHGVIIVSPTTIIPLISSYRIVKIDYERSKYAKELGEQLIKLSKDFDRFSDRWDKLNEKITSLTKQSEEVDTSVKKITVKFNKLRTSDALENTSDDEEQTL